MIECRKEDIAKEVVDVWMTKWEEMKPTIHASHTARDGQAQNRMQEAIELYKNFILSSSETDEKYLHPDNDYEVLPINGMERIQFIESRPGQYACYRQLDELFIETKKRLAALRTKK